MEQIIYLQRKKDGEFRTVHAALVDIQENLLKIRVKGRDYECKSKYNLFDFLYDNLLLGFPTEEGIVPLSKYFEKEPGESYIDYRVKTTDERLKEVYEDKDIKNNVRALNKFIENLEIYSKFCSDRTQDEVFRLQNIPMLLDNIANHSNNTFVQNQMHLTQDTNPYGDSGAEKITVKESDQ